jgi:hypothetical protein
MSDLMQIYEDLRNGRFNSTTQTVSEPTSSTQAPAVINSQLLTGQASMNSSCPTGPTGCFNDPFFHFPNLKRDSGDCFYIPTFNDVPVTISMLTYFLDSFFNEVSYDNVKSTVDNSIRSSLTDLILGDLYFNYIPIGILFIIFAWILVIGGYWSWELGLLITFVVIAALWLSFIMLDIYTRDTAKDVFSQIESEVIDGFKTKRDDILCNLIKSYYTGVMHMLIPEAAVCDSAPNLLSPTGTNPCACIDTGISRTIVGNQIDIKVPNPTNILNRQIRLGGEQRCNGINNENTLLPIIDEACPCLTDIDIFNTESLSSQKKTEVLDCILKSIGLSDNLDTDVLRLLSCADENPQDPVNPGICAIVCPTLQCTTAGTPLSSVASNCNDLFPPQ